MTKQGNLLDKMTNVVILKGINTINCCEPGHCLIVGTKKKEIVLVLPGGSIIIICKSYGGIMNILQ